MTATDCEIAGKLIVEGFQGKFEHIVGKNNTEYDNEPYRRYLGCWPRCRWSCAECVFDAAVPKDRCYVDHIVVDGNFRGKGIGKTLLQVADEEAKINNCKDIFLWVADGNRAKNLYEREGYSVTASEGGCIVKLLTGRNRFHMMEKTLE